MHCAPLTCLFATVLLAGCQSLSAELDQPASMIEINETQRLQLSRLLSDLSGQSVSLTDKAFAGSDRLVLERKRAAGSEAHRLATGRNMDPPRVFKLVKNKGQCWLLDESNGGRHQLDGFSCQVL